MSGPQMFNTALDRNEQMAQVRKACRYITDDVAIGQYLSISPEIVADERAKLPKNLLRGKIAAGVPASSYGIEDKRIERRLARSSDALLNACWALYGRMARERGLADEYEAMVLCGMAA